jgi:hypothetical protein
MPRIGDIQPVNKMSYCSSSIHFYLYFQFKHVYLKWKGKYKRLHKLNVFIEGTVLLGHPDIYAIVWWSVHPCRAIMIRSAALTTVKKLSGWETSLQTQ